MSEFSIERNFKNFCWLQRKQGEAEEETKLMTEEGTVTDII